MTIGKIFYSSWGYEQTNVDFYKVIDVSKSGKTITLQKIGSQIVAVNGYCSEEVIPNEERIIGEPLTGRRINYYSNGSSYVNVSTRSDYKINATEWKGQPIIQTSYY